MICPKFYRKWEGWDLNPGTLTSEVILLSIVLSYPPGKEDEQTFPAAKAELDDLLLLSQSPSQLFFGK